MALGGRRCTVLCNSDDVVNSFPILEEHWLGVVVSQYTSGTPARTPTAPPTHLSWVASTGCRAKKFTLFLLKSYIIMLFQSLIHNITIS